MNYVYSNISAKRANELNPGDYLYFTETDTQFAGHMRVDTILRTLKDKIIINKDLYFNQISYRQNLTTKFESIYQWVDVCEVEPVGGMNKKVAEYIQVNIYNRELKPVPPPPPPPPVPAYRVEDLINELQKLDPKMAIVYRSRHGEDYSGNFAWIFSEDTDENSDEKYLVVDFSK